MHRGSPLSPADYLDRLDVLVTAFARLLAAGDLHASVPSCPGWTLRDLGQHLDQVHRWARGAVVDGHPNTQPPQAPDEQAALAEWYTEGARALIVALRSAGPDAACWSFGPEPHTTAFWFRRQVHETAIHLWDGQASQGCAVDLDDELALDGVDEVATMMFPRQVRLGRIAAITGSVALVAVGTLDEPLGRWVLAGDGTGDAAGSAASGDSAVSGAPASAEVRGSPSALDLLMWRRVGPESATLTLAGDCTLATSVLSLALTP